MEIQWILFCPQLPAIPSSPRVMVWRKMHSYGAVGLDHGLWILPFSDESENRVVEMKEYVRNQGGSSRIFFIHAFDEETEADILAHFQQDRAQEYDELKEQCIDFLAEIEKEIKRENFSFAEYEENEQDLEKLETWMGKIQKRDFSGGNAAKEAVRWLEKCRHALQNFADQVYTHDDPAHPRKFPIDHAGMTPDSP